MGASAALSSPLGTRLRPGYCRAVSDVEPPAVNGDPVSLTERRDLVVEDSFRDGVDGLRSAYDAYGSLIHSFCSRSLGAHAARDATQEVFLTAWRNRDRFDAERGPLVAWLMGIARNKVRNSIRTDGRAPLPIGDEMTDGRVAPDPVDALSDRMLVGQALRSLPERSRKAVTLTFLEGLTQQETADHLGLPLGTVKSDIRRGLERLRRSMGAHHG